MKHINFKLLNYPFTVLVDDIGPNPPPPDQDFILLEDGTFMLTESDQQMLLESA
jgi:hypothetical protein